MSMSIFFGVTDKAKSFQIGGFIIGLVTVYVMRMEESSVPFQGKIHIARFTPVPCCCFDHFTGAVKIWAIAGC
jgi:hypothetical protein